MTPLQRVTQDAVLARLAARAPLSAPELAADLGAPAERVRRALGSLWQRGLVAPAGRRRVPGRQTRQLVWAAAEER